MDTFFEQLVKMNKTPTDAAKFAGIWIAAVLLSALLFLLIMLNPYALLAIGTLGIVGIIWGAVKLSGRLSVEYEYIFTNGDLDIDKIVAKSSRKRIVSVNCSLAEKYGKYNPAARPSGSVKKTYLLCPPDSQNAVYMIVPHKSEGNVMIVFAPDERLKGAIEKSVPRIAF